MNSRQEREHPYEVPGVSARPINDGYPDYLAWIEAETAEKGAPVMHHSRVCHFVIDVPDLDEGAAFWTAALSATEEPLPEINSHVYRHLNLPDSEIAVLLQETSETKVSKERMHLDLASADVEAEIERLEALGAARWDHQQERGFDFWVMRDPWGNEFCLLREEPP